MSMLLVGMATASDARGATARDWLERYEVVATCPDAVTFRGLVRKRLVAGVEALERLRVRVDVSRHGRSSSLLGRVQVDGAAGTRIDRAIEDPSCSALMHALSLVVAASTDELAPAAGGAEDPHGARGEIGDEWGKAQDPFADEPIDPVPPQPHTPFGWGPLVFASLQSALAPEPLVGVGLGAAFEWEESGLWKPRVELAGVRHTGPEAALSDFLLLARFEAWTVNATFCPLQLGAGEPWSLRPCLDVDAGRLTASGSGPGAIRPQQRHAPWASSGLSVHAAVAPFGGPVQVGATLGGFLPLVHHEFYFAPDIQAFEIPAVGWRASARAALAF